MVAPHERDRDAAGADLMQLRDGGKVFAGDDAGVLEPEVEEIAGQHEVVSGSRHLVQKGVEGGAHRGRHLTKVRVRDDNDPRRARGGGG